MAFLAALAAYILHDDGPTAGPLVIPAPKPRFELQAPLSGISGVMLDAADDAYGIAQDAARTKFLQARIMWIDGTANLDKINSDENCATIMRNIAAAGFNTVVLDVKPIVGFTLYPSRFAPKLNEWRGKTVPADFDPVKACLREAKANHLQFNVSMNCFSEGHRDFKIGPGYNHPEWQTTLYEPKFSIVAPSGGSFPVSSTPGKMPIDGNTIGCFADKSNLPPPQDSFYCVTLNRQGVVIEALSGVAIRNATIPTNGSMLVGSGNAANYLRADFPVGAKARFDSLPEFVKISERPDQQVPLIVDPNNPDVQLYELNMVKEVVTNYDVDAVIFDDRLRFAGLNADFGPQTERLFEQYVGRRVAWPEDVFKWTITPSMNRGVLVGPYYDAWITWRTLTIRNFIQQVQKVVKEARPRTQFGVYAGSNYGDYPKFGHNWASPDANPGYWFATPEYTQTGTASLFDFMISGCYYPTATIYDALAQGIGIGFSIEGAGQMVNRLVKDQTWVYAGISLDQFQGNPDGLRAALQAACGSTQGVMVFDLSHNVDQFWPVFQLAFTGNRQSPNSVAGLLQEVRKKRAAFDKSGKKDPPIPINSGGAGIGM